MPPPACRIGRRASLLGGGFGTSFLIDPSARMTIILLAQRLMRGRDDAALTAEIQAAAYEGLENGY